MIREIFAALKRWWSVPLEKIEELDLTPKGKYVQMHVIAESAVSLTDPLDDPKEAREYAVAGSPRHIPWSRRKKELEAAARQKRRQIESFREQA